MTAACPEPMPGRNDDIGAEIAAARDVLINCFLGILISFSF